MARDRLDTDQELAGLLLDRERLLRSLAPVLRRVGSSNPHRAQINARHAKTRGRIRRELRANADALATRLMALRDTPT